MEMEESRWLLPLQDSEPPNPHLGGDWRGDTRQFGKDLLLTTPFLPLLWDDEDS